MVIATQNDGPELVESTYWDSPHARAGVIHLSINAGAFRLLLPDGFPVRELDGARDVVISMGHWPRAGKRYAFELRFHHPVLPPYALQFGADQADRRPPAPVYPRRVTLSVWVRGPKKVLEYPAVFRGVKLIRPL